MWINTKEIVSSFPPCTKFLMVIYLFFIVSIGSSQMEGIEVFPETVKLKETMPQKENVWVFVMAGQSNMAGRGMVEARDTVPNQRILSLDSLGRWIYAKEPLHFYEPDLKGLDCGLSFARSLLPNIHEQIYIAMLPGAVGGSSIQQWLSDSDHRGVKLFSNLEELIKKGQRVGQLKAVLWHQGESDAHAGSIDTYKMNLKELINRVRIQAGNGKLPFLMGKLGSFAEPDEKNQKWQEINRIIEEIAENDPYCYFVSTGDLTDKGDKVHFDSESQRELGRRFARQFIISLSEN